MGKPKVLINRILKLSNNVGNPTALKPVVVAKLAHVDLQLESVTIPLEGKQRPRLPILVVDEITRLFETNAIVTYLLEVGKVEVTQKLLSLMNFEAHRLSPTVLAYLSEKGDQDFGVAKELTGALSELEKKINPLGFISEEVPKFEDAVIWSTLYPLFAGNDKIAAKFPKLVEWFSNTCRNAVFAEALSTVKPLSGKEGAKAIFICNPAAVVSTFCERYAKAEVTSSSKAEMLMSEDAQPTSTVSADEVAAARQAWKGPIPPAVRGKRSGPILPIAGQTNYMISSALPYVNNVPHLGNIIGCVLSADVFARYCRVRGRNILFICGTDEYGTATETKALEEGITPQQICDKYHALHSQIYKWFDISFDYFGRTTTKEQTQIGQDIFLKLYNNSYLKEMTVLQLYCKPCERFLSDRFVEGTCPSCGYEDARGDQCDRCTKYLTGATELKNPRCKVCGQKEVITKNSEQVFLDLPSLETKERIGEWLDKQSEAWTPNARHIAKSWMKEGLKERCITRDLKWGTPVPLEQYKGKVFYVWFDAPIGYISITANYTQNWKQWWMPNNKDVDIDYYQFMAKDNVPFHSILFPASLKGTNEPWTLVRHIIATEYLNYEDGKFSKSRGVGVFGSDVMDTGIPADIWRFYLIYVRPESQDSAFSWDDFMTKNNSELLNNLGNFVNRSLTFLEKFFNSEVPTIEMSEEDYRVVAEVNREIAEYVNLLELCKLRDALRQILAISKIGNVYFQSQKPWTLTKNAVDRNRCGTICGVGAQIVFLLMTLIDPFMPGVAKQIREQLNVTKPLFSLTLLPFLPPGHKIGRVSPLFQKLETNVIADLRKRFAGSQADRKENEEKEKQKVSKSKSKSPNKSPSKQSSTAATNGNANEPPPAAGGGTASQAETNNTEAAKLEAEIAKQGNIVRELKAKKADKSEIDKEVQVLLKLKFQLGLLSGNETPVQQETKSKKRGSGSSKKQQQQNK